MRDNMPTESELEILKVLWKQGPSTVRVVNEELAKAKDVGYTTTLKFMQIMTVKGLLERDETQRTHVYRPLVKELDTQRSMMDKLLNSAFGGSASKLVMQALGNKQTSREELDQIRTYLDEQLKNREGGNQ